TVLRKAGWSIEILPSHVTRTNTISLGFGEIKAPYCSNEAYLLSVKNNSVVLNANTTTGIFHGIQTLVQLLSGDNFITGCSITDFPAYQWRGYMVDVGRNYQSLAQLKEQVD